MKELETAISQLKKAMANVDKAEEEMFRQHHQVNADVAEKISIQIAGLSDELAILNRYYNGGIILN